MIALTLPWVFGLAVAGALAIAALHLLSVQRPPELLLPTARFLPDRVVRAVSRTRRPSDRWLLLLRIVALLIAGVAAAGPHWRAAAVTRVVLVVRDRGVTRDSAALRALVMRRNDRVPNTAPVVHVEGNEDANATDNPAALFPLAWRTAARLAVADEAIDSFDLHIVLSHAPDGLDAGLTAWRESWPGRVIVYHPASSSVARRVMVMAMDSTASNASDDDAVRSAFTWHAARWVQTRVDDDGTARAEASVVDTVGLARADDTPRLANPDAAWRVRVYWPLHGVPTGWRAMPAADSASALVVSGHALMGPWPVTAVPDTSAPVRAIAWYSDGRVAATERQSPRGCDRQVAVVSARASDVLLASSANGLFDQLLAPCGRASVVPTAALTVREVRGLALAKAEHFRRAATASTPPPLVGLTAWLTPLLFALALLVVLAEWRLRDRPMERAV